jgi:hypothetical protein
MTQADQPALQGTIPARRPGYSDGRQPCADFVSGSIRDGFDDIGNRHSCYGPFDGVTPHGLCTASVSNCGNCGYDHHPGGWQTCPVRAQEDPDA